MSRVRRLTVGGDTFGMLAETFAGLQRRALALVRLAEKAAGTGRFRTFSFVMRHDGLRGIG